jgi:membrane protease YdiL (CAAX protease family)
MVWVEHLLCALLIIAGPVWDHFEVPRLKANPARKVFFYQQIVGSQWPLSALALLIAGRILWHAPPSPDWAWIHSTRTPSFLWGFLLGLAAVMLLPLLGVLKPKSRAALRKAFARLAFFLPADRRQDLWFAATCITAGICEEWLFRGFLLHYLAAGPWHLSLAVALILSSGIFGLNHLYQGLGGMTASAILGALFALMYLATGSLLLPMIVHALVDLRALALVIGARPRPGDELDETVVA